MHFQTPVTHPAIELLTSNKPSRPLRMSTVAIALGLSLLLSACANIQALMGIEKKPAPSGRVIPVLDELWSIRFQPDLDDEDTPVIQGKILIQKQNQTIQSIAHRVSRNALLDEDDSWLQVVDVNNDGLPDLLITHANTDPDERSLKSLYLFDSQSQSFQLQEQLSKLGEIDKLSGCVVLTTSADKSPQRTFCLTDEHPGWTEFKLPSPVTAERCNIKAQNLAECRSMRTRRDNEMQALVSKYITARSEDLVAEKRRTAAQRFARNLRVGHQQWLQYRDARCASYVIEYNFPAETSRFEMESCKLDLSGLQLQHYSSMLASLEK